MQEVLAKQGVLSEAIGKMLVLYVLTAFGQHAPNKRTPFSSRDPFSQGASKQGATTFSEVSKRDWREGVGN